MSKKIYITEEQKKIIENYILNEHKQLFFESVETFNKLKLFYNDIVDYINNNTTADALYPGSLHDEDEGESDNYLFNSEEEFKNALYKICDFFNNMGNIITVYRSIRVDSLNDINLNQFGESWSFSMDSAVRFGEGLYGNSGNVLLKAKTDFNNVDWLETINRYIEDISFQYNSGFNENEIVIKDTSKLKDIEIDQTKLTDVDENAASDVTKRLGWKNAPNHWNGKKLKHINGDAFMGENDEVISESRSKSYGGLQYLKDHQIELTDDEKEYFKNHDVLNWEESGAKLMHKATSKDKKDGEVYFAYTHRAWGVKQTKKEAVKMAKFIKTTS